MFLLDRFICYIINKTARNWVAFCTKFDNIFDGLKSFLCVCSYIQISRIVGNKIQAEKVARSKDYVLFPAAPFILINLFISSRFPKILKKC